MSAPLIERSTGDIISSSDHNDIKSYIEDGSYRVNTLSLSIGGTEIIDSSGNITTDVGTVDGIDISTDVPLNTTHRSSNGTDHSYINQSVTTSANPSFTSLKIGGTEIIDSNRYANPVRIIAPDSSGILFYASDGSTQIAVLDDSGNFKIKGRVIKL